MTYAEEPGKLAAGALALLVHVVFLALLVFSVSWQSRTAQPMVAELWSSLPPPQKVKPLPPTKPEPVREEPTVRKQVEMPKPDIALKDKKAEKQREEKHRLEEEKKKAELEKRKLEQEKLKQQALQEKQQKEAELRRQQEQQALMRDLQAREAAAQNRQVNDYKARINAKIKRFINNQSCLPLSNPLVIYHVTLMPTGQLLLDPRLVKSSGGSQCDQAIEHAIRRAEPLPLPPEPALFSQFRELRLEFKPNEEN